MISVWPATLSVDANADASAPDGPVVEATLVIFQGPWLLPCLEEYTT